MNDDVLTTERLALHPLTIDDVERLWPFVSDPALPRFMTWDAHTERATTRAFLSAVALERARGETFTFGARLPDDTFVGVVGLHGVTRQQRAWRMDCAELGYWVAPAMQGKGYVTEAAARVLAFAFETLALHRVTVSCVTENAPSLRVIEKLGFRSVGVSREHHHREGRWWDHASFEMLASEWRARAASAPR